MRAKNSAVVDIFKHCCNAIRNGELIKRESTKDKEFHFQNWIRKRFEESSLHYEEGGRNSYPDFRLVQFAEGYEVKGLAYPGRELTYDCNSQVPSGFHNGRVVYYIFGRYPAEPDGNTYPVLDLVICHGDFLNANHKYVHKNKSIKGFGSYGDIMIRDRKMYVAPTPFRIASGLAHTQTLILPDSYSPDDELRQVGTIVRKEADKLIVGYSFDLENNSISEKSIPNPFAGQEHSFTAWRLKVSPIGETVSARMATSEAEEAEVCDEDEEK